MLPQKILIMHLIVAFASIAVSQDCLRQANSDYDIPFRDLDGEGDLMPIVNGTQAITTSYRFYCCGDITSWQAFIPPSIEENIIFDFQVWRPSSTVNSDGAGEYSLVGQNRFTISNFDTFMGSPIVRTPEPSQVISVRPGDVMGFFQSGGSGSKDAGLLLDPNFDNDLMLWFQSAFPQERLSPLLVAGDGGMLLLSTNAGPMLSAEVLPSSCTPLSTIVPAASPTTSPTPSPALQVNPIIPPLIIDPPPTTALPTTLLQAATLPIPSLTTAPLTTPSPQIPVGLKPPIVVLVSETWAPSISSIATKPVTASSYYSSLMSQSNEDASYDIIDGRYNIFLIMGSVVIVVLLFMTTLITFILCLRRKRMKARRTISDTGGMQEVTESYDYSVNEAYASNIHLTPNRSYGISTTSADDADHIYTELQNELSVHENELEYDYVN